MELAVFLPLLLLVCSVSTESVTKNADYKPPQEPLPYDINAVLREMTASLAAQKVEIEQLQKDNEEQKTRQKTEVDKQKTEVDKLKQQLQGQQVAFSASLYAKDRRHFGPFDKQTPLVYSYVPTNIGHAYDPHTGIFTAPLRGAYHFEIHAMGHFADKHAAGVVLYKNQDLVFSAYERQKEGYGSASNSVTLILEKGDEVSIRTYVHSQVFDDRFNLCTFSGHLMFTM